MFHPEGWHIHSHTTYDAKAERWLGRVCHGQYLTTDEASAALEAIAGDDIANVKRHGKDSYSLSGKAWSWRQPGGERTYLVTYAQYCDLPPQ